MVVGEPAEVEPLAHGGPGFGFQLGFGIGGDDAKGIGGGHEGPEGDHGDEGGFADAVAGGGGELDGFGRGQPNHLGFLQYLPLPNQRAVELKASSLFGTTE